MFKRKREVKLTKLLILNVMEVYMSKVFSKITNKEDIYNAISSSSTIKVADSLAKFTHCKNERITYDSSRKKYYLNSFFPSLPSKAWERMLDSMQSIKFGVHKPYQSDIVVTGKCHCNCWHCYRNKFGRDDLGLEQIKKFIDQSFALGIANCGITGGEPMLRNDIKEIIDYIPDGMEGQLYSTGHKIDDEFCEYLNTTNLTRVIISLDHYKEEIVTKTRDNKNAFQETILAIEALVRNNIYTVVTLCVNETFFAEDIESYFNFIGKFGIQEVRIVMPIPQGKIEGIDIKATYRNVRNLMFDMKNKYLDIPDAPNIVLFSEFESHRYFGCSAGAHYLTVNNDGAITPCVAVPLSFGNIYKEDLEDIYTRMKKYFKCSGITCYGRRMAKVMKELGIDTSVTPLSRDVSEFVAEHYIVDADTSCFFEDFL